MAAMGYLQVARAGMLCALYIIVSGGLINMNKYVVDKRRFPHAMQLTACHMIMCFLLSYTFFWIKPSMYPGFESTRGQRLRVFKWLVPIGCCFAVMLYGSNRAYLYCGVAFLQFMKEANVVLVFLFSVIAGLQYMTMPRVVVIAWIIAGSSICVTGDVHFALTGFILQGISQISECVRAVLAELVLTGKDFKLDPLTYTMLVSPICLVVLIVGSAITWNPDVWPDFCRMWPVLIPNSCLAFVLNVTIAIVIKEISAVGFIVCGLVKDIVLVVFSCLVFKDEIRGVQWFSFCITLSGVFWWSLMRVLPGSPAVLAFQRFWCGYFPAEEQAGDEPPIREKATYVAMNHPLSLLVRRAYARIQGSAGQADESTRLLSQDKSV